MTYQKTGNFSKYNLRHDVTYGQKNNFGTSTVMTSNVIYLSIYNTPNRISNKNAIKLHPRFIILAVNKKYFIFAIAYFDVTYTFITLI